jgi:hypothetical protein
MNNSDELLFVLCIILKKKKFEKEIIGMYELIKFYIFI